MRTALQTARFSGIKPCHHLFPIHTDSLQGHLFGPGVSLFRRAVMFEGFADDPIPRSRPSIAESRPASDHQGGDNDSPGSNQS